MTIRLWLCSSLLALSSIASAKPERYWICAGQDGVRAAQDRACDANQTTIRRPPELSPPSTAAMPATPSTPPPITVPRPAPPAAPVTASLSGKEKPRPLSVFQPIVDVAIRGFGLTALLIVLIFGIRAAFAASTRPGRARRFREPGPRQTVDPWRRAGEPTQGAHGDRTTGGPVAVIAPLPTVPRWNLELLRSLDWKRFEELCQRFWVLKGFAAELTGPGADDGIDIRIAARDAPKRTFAVAQCKAWAEQAVDVETVRALWGACAHFEAKLGLVYGIAGFTDPARRFEEGKHLKLIDGPELLRQIAALPAAEQQSLLEEITRGDYTTPSCPQCESRLVIKPNRPGWWSCPQFPKCRYVGIPVRKSPS